ncbi:MAG TPA: hypothetical protein ENI34_05195 [candidate division WOR-3 bacterium]|uniref:Bacterial type II secretion system protein E domain-containing protein n=1 Tax=candidate division WOR-3 bacterium TaxID=2052148 RepID=A0A9C9EM27_UNCW3|nr:hypothetical protein [candidate division WOR-3 bacterium]
MKRGGKTLGDFLKVLWREKGQDLIISVGSPPVIRKPGTLIPIGENFLTPEQVEELIYSVLNSKQKKIFEDGRELNFSFGIRKMGRFIANIFRQRGAPSAVFRFIPFKIPKWDEIDIPKKILPLLNEKNGLVVVSGLPGSGTREIMASLIEYINEHREVFIITIEEPIEYLHHHKKSIINQRQIGYDTESFSSAVEYIESQGPDVVVFNLVDSKRRLQSVLELAERCCLCMILFRIPDAKQCLNYIIKSFPVQEQPFVRERLADSLLFILTSRIVETKKKIMLKKEVLINNSRLKTLLKSGKFKG